MPRIAKIPEGRARIALQQQGLELSGCMSNIKREIDEVKASYTPDVCQSSVSSSSGSLDDVQSHRDYWLERDYYGDAIKAEVIS